MYDKIRQLLGSYPSRLYSRVKRSILDVNREVDEGTFGNSLAVSLYNIYHAKIQEWVNKCETEGRNCIVIDLHGYVSTHTSITQLGEYLHVHCTDLHVLRPLIIPFQKVDAKHVRSASRGGGCQKHYYNLVE